MTPSGTVERDYRPIRPPWLLRACNSHGIFVKLWLEKPPDL
jgi:hypothetical protein